MFLCCHSTSRALGRNNGISFFPPSLFSFILFCILKFFLTSRKVTNAIHICCWVDRLYSFAFNVLAVQNIRSQPWVCSSHYEMYDDCLWNSISWFCKMESSWLNWEYWRIKGKLAKIKKKNSMVCLQDGRLQANSIDLWDQIWAQLWSPRRVLAACLEISTQSYLWVVQGDYRT